MPWCGFGPRGRSLAYARDDKKVRFGGTPKPALETSALPRSLQFPAGETLERLHVLRCGLFNHRRRKFRSRRGLVPVQGLEVIAHELFIEAGRASPNDILIP